MAPGRSSGNKDLYIHEIDRTPEYVEFIQKLQTFHDKRGTSFEPEPRLPTMHGHVNVDLLKLYKAVVAKGGYDELCRVQKSWGVLAAELGMHMSDSKGVGQLSFQLKQDFYRYLSAYWIQDQYGREPPPKEILEQQSCASKLGPVATRTPDNFKLSSGRSGVETPSRDERPGESTPVSGNRASGRLREAPPQRVPFQPETGPSRQPRQTSQHATPTATATTSAHNPHPPNTQPTNHHLPQLHNSNNPLHLIQAQQAALRGASSTFTPTNPETASRLLESFEPRPPISVPLRPMNTPGNNPVEFAKRQRQLRAAASVSDSQVFFRPALPGIGFEGPNIYMRCLQALRSGIPAEQSFALNHLVKISFERGDKYKFESFLGLAEGLIEKALEISNLFLGINWEISYLNDQVPLSNDAEKADITVLDGFNGTKDILTRIDILVAKNPRPRRALDHMQPAEFNDQLLRITEAVLTIRNMVMLVENAIYMADVYPLKDLLCIILTLPNLETLVEIKHFALDIAEQLTPWLMLEADDPLYSTLLNQLLSSDRGTILTALRAVSRISMNLEATNKLQDVPNAILANIMGWLLLNDEELMDACLDFLYQYTAVVANVNSLLTAVNMEHVVPHLVRLLAHGAKRVKEDKVLEPERKAPASEEVAALPPDLQEELTKTDEPQRCFKWLQSLFEEDSESHITQIAIWQAYQSSFGALAGGSRNVLSAADFIRNVSHVFSKARAQIIRSQRPGQTDLFIIEGIRARTLPMDPETKDEYSACRWVVTKGPHSKKCGQFFLGGEKMWYHVLVAHLGVVVGGDGKIENKEVNASCDWENCHQYPQPTQMRLSELTRHIKTHFAWSQKRLLSEGSTESSAKRQRRAYVTPAKTMSLTWEQTIVTRDERNPKSEQAAGIPLSAVLVLRNIARNVVKTESEEKLLKEHEMGGEGGGWNEKLFRPVMARLFEVMTENRALADYIASLLQLVQEDYEPLV